MPKAKETFYAKSETSAKPLVFYVGDDVPADVAEKVGTHVLDYTDDDEPGALTVTLTLEELAAKFDEFSEGRIYTQDDLDEAVDEAVAKILAEVAKDEPSDDEKRPAEDPSVPEVYDPSAHPPKDVATYLGGLDQSTVEGKAEYDRVVASEKAGKNRSTAIPS